MAKGNVGDRIRVVDADFESSYSNGDVGVIVQAPVTLSGADIHFDNQQYETSTESDYLYGHEYELIHETSSATEEAIPWELGQEVFCLLRGKGTVVGVDTNTSLWMHGVTVLFEKHGQIRYALDGKVAVSMNRSLFFSEPEIVADKLPPKKTFIPVLKKGEQVVLVSRVSMAHWKIIVDKETDALVFDSTGQSYVKEAFSFYKQEIEFNV